MNTAYRHLLPAGFHPSSRVWIYQCNRLFSMSEALQIEDLLNQFTAGWNSHGTPVKGWASLFFGQFIVLMADETAAGRVVSVLEGGYSMDGLASGTAAHVRALMGR